MKSRAHWLSGLGARRGAAAILLAVIALPVGPAPATAQEEGEREGEGEQVSILSGAEEIELSGRVQIQALTSSCAEEFGEPESPCTEDVPGVNWFARRIRMALDVTVSDFVSGEIQPDFGEVDGVELKNAYGRLTFGPGAKLQIGQFKKPFDGFHLTSSTQILTVERDLDIPGVPGPVALSTAELTTRNLLSSYDLGAMLFGEVGEGVRYWIGTFDGRPPEANSDVNSDKQFVGRFQYSLEAGGLPLSVAVAGALTDRPFTGPDGELGGQYYSNLEFWAELGDFERGPHVQAGFYVGENALETESGAAPSGPDPDLANMNSWQVIGTWKTPVEDVPHLAFVEPVLRVTRSEPNTDVADDEVWGVTPGVQLFVNGRNKVALNWDFAFFPDDDRSSENSFKMQYQFHF